MTGRSAFNYVTRTLLIDYDVDHLKDDGDFSVQNYDHNSKSLIKWRVTVRLYYRMLCIEPVDVAVNQIFKYNLSVTLNGKPRNYGPGVYNGARLECHFPHLRVRWIQIKIVYPDEAINQNVPAPVKKSKTRLPKMITNARSRDKFADVQFIVEDKVIVGHKVILGDRSEVFYKMFTWNVDNDTNSCAEPVQISIVDASYDGFNRFIDAIYFGTTPTDPEMCMEIVTLAEKYDVQDIKAAMEGSIISSINMDRAINILINAYLNNAERIKKSALEFCAKSPMHEMNGNKELAKYPDLLSEVFKQISLTKNL